MPAPELIQELVRRFEEHRETYHTGRYNETQLRREFLDPFFEALGWDVLNRQGYAETYKEVVHEDSLEVEGALKAPDYAFRVGGQRKFFVEAKKPSVNIQSDMYPAFQLRRYSWSAKLPLGVLSDFEEFAVYDCRSKPDKKDKATTGRVAYYSYREYVAKWDEIAAIFSREAVLKGSFDQYAEGVRGKKGTAEVDDAFLAEIERWRDVLARNFALRNPSLTTRELNYAVQMTIDRIIFLRICEDRGIERYGKLQELLTPSALSGTSPQSAGKESSQQNNSADLGEAGRGSIYEGLCQIFKQADARYNSGLFHFQDEKEASSAADSLTLSLNVDDKVLREILGGLYYPESPYVFSEIPSDILGQVYERFLGKVIRLTTGHQAKVEEKPEVRKAGGVYYTPAYIVEYIVRNTVGKLLEGERPEGSLEKSSSDPHQPSGRSLTPKEVSRLKILDPACGSGTFPLGAYQYLLDWHLKWYIENDPEKWAKGKNPAIFQTAVNRRDAEFPESQEKLGAPGVFSPQNGAGVKTQGEWRLTTAEKKRILLNNIYGVDIDPQAVEVTKLSLLLKVLENESEQTIGSQLGLFQERALPDLGRNIKCGNSLIGPDYYEGHQLTMGFADDELRYKVNAFDWKAEFPQVFLQGGFDVVIGNPPYLFIIELEQPEKDYYFKRYETTEYRFDVYGLFTELATQNLLKENGYLSFIIPHTLLSNDSFAKLRRLLLSTTFLDLITDIGPRVFETARNETMVFVVRKGKIKRNETTKVVITDSKQFPIPTKEFSINQDTWQENKNASWTVNISNDETHIISKIEEATYRLGKLCTINQGARTGNNNKYLSDTKAGDLWKPAAGGKHVGRYSPLEKNVYIYYDPKVLDAPRKPEIFTSPEKILVQEIRNITLPRRIVATYDNEQFYGLQSTNVINLRSDNNIRFEIKYLLGILNSTCVNYFFKQRFSGNNHIASNQLAQIPIPNADKARHEKMVSLVERMLELHKQSAVARSPLDKERVAREIESTDRAIDRLVYELYGLTEDEIAIVEGKE